VIAVHVQTFFALTRYMNRADKVPVVEWAEYSVTMITPRSGPMVLRFICELATKGTYCTYCRYFFVIEAYRLRW
jgi:hypothetical protein